MRKNRFKRLRFAGAFAVLIWTCPALWAGGGEKPAEAVADASKASEPASELENCRRLLENESYKELVTRSTAILESRPDCFEARFLRARALYNLGQTQRAVEDLDIIIKAGAADEMVYSILANCLVALNRCDEAIEANLAATRCNPKFGLPYYNLAVLYERTGKLDEAIRCIDTFAAIHGNVFDALEYRAKLYLLRCRTTGDKIQISPLKYQLDMLISENPCNSVLYRLRCEIFIVLKDYKQALADIDMAVKLSPKEAPLIFIRAGIYLDMKRPTDAMRDILAGRKYMENSLGNWLNLAKLYYHLDRDEAGSCIEKALELEPNSGEVLRLCGIINSDLGHRREAIESFTRALEVESSLKIFAPGDSPVFQYPAPSDLYFLRGRDLLYTGEYLPAWDDFSRALTDRTDDPKCTYLRGVAAYCMGDYAGALQDFDSALKTWPNNPAVLCFRALARRRLDDHGYMQDILLAQRHCDGQNEKICILAFSAIVQCHPNAAANAFFQSGNHQDKPGFGENPVTYGPLDKIESSVFYTSGGGNAFLIPQREYQEMLKHIRDAQSK